MVVIVGTSRDLSFYITKQIVSIVGTSRDLSFYVFGKIPCHSERSEESLQYLQNIPTDFSLRVEMTALMDLNNSIILTTLSF